jgi:hypothetical protein
VEGVVFDWLFEGQRMVYVLLAAVAVLCLFLWQQDRRRHWLLLTCGAIGVLAVAYYLLDVFVETDREQITLRLQRMAAGVRQRDVQSIFEHISENFQRGGMNRDSFRTFVARAIDSGQVDEVEVWGFEFPDKFRGRITLDRGPSPGPAEVARVSFKAKPKGALTGSVAFYLCDARFIRDPDQQWRLFDFQVFNPAADSHTPLQIPGMP